MGTHDTTSDLEIWTEQVGLGPDVLLIGGLGDTVESWQFQLDGLANRYRLTAFDNRGAGKTAMPDGLVSAELMADDAAAVLRALEIHSAHVAGFSMGSAIGQELALRHPELVRSLVLQSTCPPRRAVPLPAQLLALAASGGPQRARLLRGVLHLGLHPAGARRRFGGPIVEEALAFPHQQSVEAFQAQVEVCLTHDTADRLPQIAAPTLVLSGELDTILPPRFGRSVAAGIPNARFDVLPGEAHQPFQEIPDQWNARVDAFWRQIEKRD
jgi:3-oxoadipate enol-lactonase